MILSRLHQPGRLVLGLFVALAMTASAAKADSVTFATFQETDNGNEFKYDTNGGNAGAGGLSYFVTNKTPLNPNPGNLPSPNGTGSNVTPQSIDVNFAYVLGTPFTTGLAAPLQGNQAAKMTLSAVGDIGVVVFGGFAIQQHMAGFLEIRRTTAYLGKDLLLRVDFGILGDPSSGGRYQGTINGQTVTLAADKALGEYVKFSSDFIDFTGSFDDNMSLTFTSVTPRLVRDAVSRFFKPHTEHGTGSFGAALIVPEPGTIACALTGIVFAGVAVLRRRAAKTA